jgi:hypothetical protein
MTLTIRVLKAFDDVLPKMFADPRLYETAIYKRLTGRAFDEVGDHGKRAEEETTLTVVKVDERVDQSSLGHASSGQRVRYYIARLEEMPEAYDENSVLEDKLEVGGVDWAILNAEMVLNRICILEVAK